MEFVREFKVLPYWKDWYNQVQERRTGGNKTSTEIMEFDKVKYGFGGQSVTIPPDMVNKFIGENLNELYSRDNLALKVFYRDSTVLTEPMCNLNWGMERNLVICSKAQNMIAIDGMAPRVYDLVFLVNGDEKYPAQVTEFVEKKKPTNEEYEVLKSTFGKICSKYCIVPTDIVKSNFFSNKFVDFGGTRFGIGYIRILRKKIRENLGFGDINIPYQTVPELQVKGKRDVVKRAEVFKKAFKEDRKLLPDNFSVIDYGCNAGFFLRQAFEWGASYGVGVERVGHDVIRELCYYMRYFNIDVFDKLPQPVKKFDVAFFLSMDQHVKFEEFLPYIGKVLYLEGHNIEQPQDRYMPMLQPHFKEVGIIGNTSDFGERVLIKAIR